MMTPILPTLFLGCLSDVPCCPAHGITHTLTLCEQRPESGILLVHRPIPDETWLPGVVWQGLVLDLHELLAHRHTVLVHCRLGVSRSPALVAAYLATYHHKTFFQAWAWLKEQRPVIHVHAETLRGVLEAMTETPPLPSPYLMAIEHPGLPSCPQCRVRQWLQGLTYYQCAQCGYQLGPDPGESLGYRKGHP